MVSIQLLLLITAFRYSTALSDYMKKYHDNVFATRQIDALQALDDNHIVACHEVITEQLCTKLINLCEEVGLPRVAVEDSIKDAQLQGAYGAEEIYEKAVQYLEGRMLCDLLLSLDMCIKILHNSAAKHVVYHEVDGLLQIYIAKGVTNRDILFSKLMKFIDDNHSAHEHDSLVKRWKLTGRS